MAEAEEICSHLPDDLWEHGFKLRSATAIAASASASDRNCGCIFKSLNCDRRTLKSLSVFSKQFLSITNRLRFSVTITDETIPYLPRLFHRFPNLTSLNLILLSKTLEQVNELLTLISTFPLDIKSLNLSDGVYTIPASGLIALSKTMKNLRSLTFDNLLNYDKKDLFLIANCFPLLEELNLSYPLTCSNQDFMLEDNDPLLALPKLRKINLSGNNINNQFIDFLRQNCRLLQEITLKDRKYWPSRRIYL
ncbi:uncharacterized protein LOC131602553 [Vicia villosa]|uniref:uncharacterized protein LOC131602553 n=1 Tax=Vicia villosa TaxID=3911 RepID=UPI00273C4ACB|nr:uncharacterized protein LOC131602553 [Vicia villosa]